MEVVAAPLEGVARWTKKSVRGGRGGRERKRKREEGTNETHGGKGREGERALVHAEIAQPLTILRYYARPFLRRSLHSRARKSTAILEYGIERRREEKKKTARDKNAAFVLSLSRSRPR